MKAQVACLSRVTLLCLLLAAPAMADSIPYSVAFRDGIANEWNPDHGFRVEAPFSSARTSSGNGFDLSFSGAWPGDPLLAVSSDVSTLLSGLVSDRITGFVIPPNAVPPTSVPPNAVPPAPVPEPSGLLVMLGSGILGLGGVLGAKLKTKRDPNRNIQIKKGRNTKSAPR